MRNRVLWMCFSFYMLCGLAFADGIDPVMQVNDPLCTADVDCGATVGGPTGGDPFTFNSNGAGGGSFRFNIGATVGNLDIETPGTFGATTDVHCTSNVFGCQVRFLGGVTDMFLSCIECSGIPNGFYFTIVLNDVLPNNQSPVFDPNGAGGWGPNRQFTAQANLRAAPINALISAPEPSISFLLVTSGAALVGRRKFRLNQA